MDETPEGFRPVYLPGVAGVFCLACTTCAALVVNDDDWLSSAAHSAWHESLTPDV